jgi:hypothetical protein
MVKVVPDDLNPGEAVAAEFRNAFTIAAMTSAIGPNVEAMLAMKAAKNSRRTMMMMIRAPKKPTGSEASGNPYTVPV